MQRIKKIRWPTRNPMGDALYYKFKATYGKAVNILDATSNIDIIPAVQFNSIPALAALFGNAPGLTFLANSYEKYRVTGVTVSHTVWPTPDAIYQPTYVYTNAGGTLDDVDDVPSVSTIPEMRWTKSRLVRMPSEGGKPTTISTYYSVNKIMGPDSVVRNDLDYTGETVIGAPTGWDPPANGPLLRTGLYTMTGANVSGRQDQAVKTTLTVHCKFFQKRLIVS